MPPGRLPDSDDGASKSPSGEIHNEGVMGRANSPVEVLCREFFVAFCMRFFM